MSNAQPIPVTQTAPATIWLVEDMHAYAQLVGLDYNVQKRLQKSAILNHALAHVCTTLLYSYQYKQNYIKNYL